MEAVPFTPNDYSSTYWVKLDAEENFVELVRVSPLPPEWDDGESTEITDRHIEFAKNYVSKWKERRKAIHRDNR